MVWAVKVLDKVVIAREEVVVGSLEMICILLNQTTRF
jgi:hypothetical protein